MHVVFIQGFAIILPLGTKGYTAEAVAIFSMINGLHGLISHFNVDVLMGWLF